MNLKTCLLWMSVLLVYPTLGSGQITTVNFEILPGSTYTYFAGNFAGIGVDNCSPNDFQCDYGLAGLFSLEIDSNGSASITNSNLELTGNETAGPGGLTPLTNAAGLQAWLEGLDFFSIPTLPTSAGFQAQTFPEQTTLLFDTPGINGSLTGGFDLRGGDGDGISIQASLRQVAVPEPSTATTILVLFTVATFYVRRRVG